MSTTFAKLPLVWLRKEWLRKGGKSGAGTVYTPKEAADSLRSRSIVRLQEVLCEGPIWGFANEEGEEWFPFIYLDDTRLMNLDGSMNFRLSAVHFRHGLPSDTPMPGFSSAENEVSVGVQVKKDLPITRAITNPQATVIRVKVRVPALMEQKTNGDLVGAIVEWAIDLQVGADPFLEYVKDTIEGKTSSGYERNITLRLPPRDGTPINVRVRRLTNDSTDSTLRNDTYFSSFTEVVEATLMYPDTAMVGFTIDAEQFPAIPRRAFHIKGLIVRVPVNYDPVERTYDGDWDGTFKYEFTDNPAWHLYDLLLSERYGFGRDIVTAHIDKWSLYEAAKYNDGLVSNGEGGFEPRFRFNYVFNTREEGYKNLQAIASAMRAQVYYGAGTIITVQDRPHSGPPDRLFSPSDVIGGAFDYSSTNWKQRPTIANVTWFDPGDFHRPKVETVAYPEMLAKYGHRDVDVAAYGVTTRGAARRFGRWMLFVAHHETEMVGFTVGLENADLAPGQLIWIADPVRAGVRQGGRVASFVSTGADTGTLTLDADPPEWEGGTIYANAILPDGETTAIRQLALLEKVSAGVYSVSGLDNATIQPNAMWIMSSPTVVPTPWRVLSVMEKQGLEFEVIASFFDERKFDYAENGWILPALPFNPLPTGPLAPPTAMAAEEYYYIDPTGASAAGIAISWTPSTDPRVIHYELAASNQYNEQFYWSTLPEANVHIAPASGGPWQFRLYGIDALGRRTPLVSFTWNADSVARRPLPPENMAATVRDNTVHLSWLNPDDLSISYYWLKHSSEIIGATWDTATTIAPQVPRSSVALSLPFRGGTYFMKSVSVRGRTSEDAASTIVFDDPRGVLWMGEQIEETDWDGDKNNVSVVTGELFLDASSLAVAHAGVRRQRFHRATPTVEDAEVLAFNRIDPVASGVYTAPEMVATEAGYYALRVLFEARGVVDSDIMANWIPLSSAVPLARVSSDQWEAFVEYRIDPDTGVWGPWLPLTLNEVFLKKVQFRLILASYDPSVDVKVSSMKEQFGGVLLNQEGSIITDASGDATITYPFTFLDLPVVLLTPHSNPAVLVRVNSENESMIQIKTVVPTTGANAPAIPVDWAATGYGRTT
jgi:predicted phage tail protein